MIKAVTFAAEQPGPKLLVTAAIHGNETCGAIACQRVIDEIEKGATVLKHGQITFVPICNPRAYAEGKRFIERNLNRYLMPMEKPDSYEARLGNILCPLLEACDVLLDIHSYTIGGAAFASTDADVAEGMLLAKAIGAPMLVHGWEAAYAVSGKAESDPNESVGTTAYASRHGAQAILLESGQHKDPQSPEIAYQAIHHLLEYLAMVPDSDAQDKAAMPRSVKIERVIYRTDPGVLTQDWNNFAPVKKGELLATRANGETINAPADGCIVLPNRSASAGAEWFYFGVFD